MAARKTYTVDWPGGVCLRENPSRESKIVEIISCGKKVKVDPNADAPAGWTAVVGGFIMSEYLK